MLRGTPRWLADVTIGHPKVARFIRPLARPVPAFVLFNTTFIVIHWPDLVADGAGWAAASPGPRLAVRRLHPDVAARALAHAGHPQTPPPGQMFYLFAQSLLPTIPASFLTFSTVPLYPVYGDAALAFGLTAVADQTIAGVIMKAGRRPAPVVDDRGDLVSLDEAGARKWERLESTLRAS